MNKQTVLAVVLALTSSVTLLGCGSTTTPAASASNAAQATTPASAPSASETQSSSVAELAAADPIGTTPSDAWATQAPTPLPEQRIEGLPEAPWRTSALQPTEVPQELLSAWSQAPNRSWCAPLTPSTLGAARGATPRAASLLGGWSVEFDRAGMPGVDSEGEACRRCGRGVFGIAGTVLAAEDMEDAEEGTPSFADGSRAQIEASEEAATATITVAGEGCVYQVWSFLGEAHLRQLVRSLRRVETGGEAIAGL